MLEHFDGNFSADSVGASVYMTSEYVFRKTILADQIPDKSLRLAMVNLWYVESFITRFLDALAKDKNFDSPACSSTFELRG